MAKDASDAGMARKRNPSAARPKFIENQSDDGAAIYRQEVIRMDEERSSTARIIYATEPFLHRNRSVGKHTEPVEFESVEQAKKAPFPEGFTFAHMSVADGYHVYSPKLGWIFYG